MEKPLDLLSFTTIQSCVQTLVDLYCCPVCLDVVAPNAVQCVNEHLCCRECMSELPYCPTCRQPFSKAKLSRLISQVIEALPKSCIHKNCKAFVEPEDDHEKYCGFKETTCKLCPWVGPGKDISEHIMADHPNCRILPAINNSLLLPNFRLQDPCLAYTPYSVNDYFIWLRTENNPTDRKFHRTCYLVPNGKPKHDIFFKLSFSSKNTEFLSKIKLNPDPDCLEDNTIYVPWSSLPDFIDSENNLKFRVYFSTEET